jgi:excisionase family DNA binding protein
VYRGVQGSLDLGSGIGVTQWNVVLELDTTDEDVIETLLDGIHGLGLVGSPTDWGTWQVTLTLEASTLVEAASQAVERVEAVGKVAVRSLRALSTIDFDSRSIFDADVVFMHEATELLGVSRQRIHQLIASGGLPARRFGRQVGIPRSAIDYRIKKMAAAGDDSAPGSAGAESRDDGTDGTNSTSDAPAPDAPAVRPGGTPATLRHTYLVTGEVVFEDATIDALIERAFERARAEADSPDPFYWPEPHPDGSGLKGARMPVLVQRRDDELPVPEQMFVVIPDGSIGLPYSGAIVPDTPDNYLHAAVVALSLGTPVEACELLWDANITALGDGTPIPLLMFREGEAGDEDASAFVAAIERDFPILDGGIILRRRDGGHQVYVRDRWDRCVTDLARLRESWWTRVEAAGNGG